MAFSARRGSSAFVLSPNWSTLHLLTLYVAMLALVTVCHEDGFGLETFLHYVEQCLYHIQLAFTPFSYLIVI